MAISHLRVVCSALSSFEDALNEAVYEEIDHLVTMKEDLLSSTDVYPLPCPPRTSGCQPSLSASHVLSECADAVCTPDSQKQPSKGSRMAPS